MYAIVITGILNYAFKCDIQHFGNDLFIGVVGQRELNHNIESFTAGMGRVINWIR